MKTEFIHNLLDTIVYLNTEEDPLDRLFGKSEPDQIPPVSKSLLLDELYENLSFSSLTIHLLGCLKEAVWNEDYESAHLLKIEISTNIGCIETKLLERGAQLLTDFDEGCNKSNHLRGFTPLSNYLRLQWEYQVKLSNFEIILTRLRREMKILSILDLDEEIDDSIFTEHYSHPVLTFDYLDFYFSLLIPSDLSSN
ncbi:MAG: hypothetical protein RLP15_08290 [Cryomorphaceae bacterium]